MSTRTGKPRKRKRIGRLRDKGQSAAFIKAAKELGLDKSSEDFEKVLDKLIPKAKKLKGERDGNN